MTDYQQTGELRLDLKSQASFKAYNQDMIA